MKTIVTSIYFPILFFSLLMGLVIAVGCNEDDLIEPQGIQLRIQKDTVFFAVIGDYGEAGPIASEVSEMVDSWNPEFIITTGDNNYHEGEEETLDGNVSQYYCDYIYNPDAPEEFKCYGEAYKRKFNRFFPCPGNHDYNPKDGLIPYLNYFTLPGMEVFYDFTWGPVHFFSLNSGKNGKEKCCKSDQTKWLKEKSGNSLSSWKLAFIHHSPFSTSHHGSQEEVQWPFEKWGINAVISGHDHSYQRIIPQEKDAIPYFVNGLGGHPYIYDCDVHPLSKADFEVTCYNASHGAMQVSATNDQIQFSFFSIEDWKNPIDSYTIQK